TARGFELGAALARDRLLAQRDLDRLLHREGLRGLCISGRRGQHRAHDVFPLHVSYLNAWIGSSRDARTAGYNPNTTPTPPATANAIAAVAAGNMNFQP